MEQDALKILESGNGGISRPAKPARTEDEIFREQGLARLEQQGPEPGTCVKAGRFHFAGEAKVRPQFIAIRAMP